MRRSKNGNRFLELNEKLDKLDRIKLPLPIGIYFGPENHLDQPEPAISEQYGYHQHPMMKYTNPPQDVCDGGPNPHYQR